ncbi:receptor-type tyrosine-protein phosphatase S-like isoform X2 [Gigantopelta aegis]|uniref:receptor-type tyrosine-protein phosphatase S-like isoform X2 n=1 Tax=Gigantopelta aegis TaxID=1735272 RepID=UPI001B887F03|nr:receptor-type tyrosine-protein phosphatase S-like isoform X2 [Gigantopelta aegis]
MKLAVTVLVFWMVLCLNRKWSVASMTTISKSNTMTSLTPPIISETAAVSIPGFGETCSPSVGCAPNEGLRCDAVATTCACDVDYFEADDHCIAQPGSVRNLTTVNSTSTGFTVTWLAPEHPNGVILGYKIIVNNSATRVWTLNLTCQDVNDTEGNDILSIRCETNAESFMKHTIWNLVPFELFSVTVAAYNETGLGNSSTITANTTIGEPKVPTSFAAELVNGSKFHLEWTPALPYPGPTKFYIEICQETERGSGIFTNCWNITVPDEETSHDETLQHGCNYKFKLFVSTEAGIAETNSTAVIKTKDSKSGLVRNLTVVNSTSTGFTVRWLAPMHPNGVILRYEITVNYSTTRVLTLNLTCQKEDDSEDNEIESIQCETNMESYMDYTISNLVPFKNFSVTIAAYNDVGVGKSSIITSMTAVGKPKTPTSFGADVIDASTVRLTWTPASPYPGPTNYSVLVWHETHKNSGVFTNEKNTTSTATICTITNLLHGWRYKFTLFAETEAGKSPFRNSTVVTTLESISAPVSTHKSTVAIVLCAIGGILAVVFIAIAVWHYKARDRRQLLKENESDEETEAEDAVDLTRPIKMSDFSRILKELHKDSNLLFKKQYLELEENSPEMSHEMASLLCNRTKNRYINILAYDHSLVKLVSLNEDGCSGYINANFIPGYNSPREYIATQGPNISTIDDFWRMIWEKKVPVIVMLTEIMDEMMPKCALYWPEDQYVPTEYANIMVTLMTRRKFPTYTLKTFKLCLMGTERTVKHFFIHDWQDFDANLNICDVVNFICDVRQARPSDNESGPTVVHCSAGVGRSGTFIALDYFIQFIEKHSLEDNIDIFQFVLKMRRNRPLMVQSETQYIFIHDTLEVLIKQKLVDEEGQCNGMFNTASYDKKAFAGEDDNINVQIHF